MTTITATTITTTTTTTTHTTTNNNNTQGNYLTCSLFLAHSYQGPTHIPLHLLPPSFRRRPSHLAHVRGLYEFTPPQVHTRHRACRCQLLLLWTQLPWGLEEFYFFLYFLLFFIFPHFFKPFYSFYPFFYIYTFFFLFVNSTEFPPLYMSFIKYLNYLS